MQTETWRDVVGQEGRYEVSSHGRVRSVLRTFVVERRPGWFVERTMQPKVIRPGAGSNGYLGVCIGAQGTKRETRLVQHLVLESFVGPRPAGMYCCHKDGNRQNNAIDNLRWDTPTSTSQDAELHGTKAQGSRNGSAVLSERQVSDIRSLTDVLPIAVVSEVYGVHRVTVQDIINRVTWKHV